MIWRVRGRRHGRPWLSAWIGGIAVIVALLLALSRAGQAAESS